MKKTAAFIFALVFIGNTYLAEFAAASDGSYTLDYNVLTKYVEFTYGEVKAVIQNLPSNTSLAEYQWKSNTAADITGKLKITNASPGTYGRDCENCGPCTKSGVVNCICVQPFGPCPERHMVWKQPKLDKFPEIPLGSNNYEFEAKNLNVDIGSGAATITGNPVIYATLRRGMISGDGIFKVDTNIDIKKPYQTRTRTSDTDPATGDLSYTDWSGWSNAGDRQGRFNNKPSNHKNVSVKVYNGMENLRRTPEFNNEIEYDEDRERKISGLFWESTKLPIEVIRMMYTETSGGLNATRGNLINMRAVKGQYKRSFVEQNKAELKWSTDDTMHNGYGLDRYNASARNYSTYSDQKAVFASDVSYEGILFPIKSGYFFNPTGKYTFTITTELFKRTKPNPTEGGTPEHKHLVNELINSFRYETNMVYINPNPRNVNYRKAVGIDNNPLNISGTAYAGVRTFITAAGSPLVQVKVDRDYALEGERTEELMRKPVTQTIDTSYTNHSLAESITDIRFRRVLEGYNESDTRSSRTGFKYTEYVQENAKIFKVVETTIVTITINPNNRRLYTHAMMRNGNYYIRALSADISLGRFDRGGEYQLNNLPNAAGSLVGYVLELINVNVVGSIFDDLQ